MAPMILVIRASSSTRCTLQLQEVYMVSEANKGVLRKEKTISFSLVGEIRVFPS
jgi:hypothetical protein